MKKCNIEKNFRYLKNILNNEYTRKEEIEGYFFPTLAIQILKESYLDYFLNPYYSLTVADILNMTRKADSLEDVKNDLFYEYKEEYASAWYENYIYVLESIETN